MMQHINVKVPLDKLQDRLPLHTAFAMVSEMPDIQGLRFIFKNNLQAPLLIIAKFLKVKHDPSRNMISGKGGIVDMGVGMAADQLLISFACTCCFNGRSFLPVPLSDSTVTLVSATTYWWQTGLRLLGDSARLLLEGSRTYNECRYGAEHANIQ